ncbi:MAG: serine protease [Candidatus Moranbacteria bacterium]|nr:serine protease [Candidatus Moranbacteria bacterium]
MDSQNSSEKNSQPKKPWHKRCIRGVLFLMVVLIFGGVSGAIFVKAVFPWLATFPVFAENSFFQQAIGDNVTIINKTEQVVVREDSSINTITSQASATVVTVIAKPGQDVAIPKPVTISSGVILTGDGYIVTYADSVDEKETIYKVILSDGHQYDASVEGFDSYTKLLFLKVEDSNLPAIALANSNDVRPGKKVVGIANSVISRESIFTTGIVSAVDVTFNTSGEVVASSEKLEGVLRTDFVDHKKFLGSPVVDYNSELVGVIAKVAIGDNEEYYEIPSNAVRDALNRTVDKTLDKRAVLGVSYQSLNKFNAVAKDFEQENGALIFSPSGRQGLAVLAGSSAQKAGIKVGDIITKVGQTGVSPQTPLSTIVAGYSIGETVEMTIIREKKEQVLTVKF